MIPSVLVFAEYNTQQIEQTSADNNKQVKYGTNKSSFLNYFVPDENPVFGSKHNMIGITYGYDIDREHITENIRRHLHNITFQYSRPFKFFGLHARYSAGIFAMFGYDDGAIDKSKWQYRNIGVEFLPEIIVGNKEFYITAGVGVSYMFGRNLIYESNNNQPGNGYYLHCVGGLCYNGMTNFNFPITVSIGHRFENNIVVELLWKHYSNGHLGEVNYDANFVGVSIRYVFGQDYK